MALSCRASAKNCIFWSACPSISDETHNSFVIEHDRALQRRRVGCDHMQTVSSCRSIWLNPLTFENKKIKQLPVAFFSFQSPPVSVGRNKNKNILSATTSNMHMRTSELINVPYVITKACLRCAFSSLNWFSSASSSTVYACKNKYTDAALDVMELF